MGSVIEPFAVQIEMEPEKPSVLEGAPFGGTHGDVFAKVSCGVGVDKQIKANFFLKSEMNEFRSKGGIPLDSRERCPPDASQVVTV